MMGKTYLNLAAMVILLVVLTSACANFPGLGAVSGSSPTKAPAPTTATPQKDFEEFDRNSFNNSTVIDNKYFAFKPWTQYIYIGYTKEDGEEVLHRLVKTVTDMTKMINGVRSVVTYDLDFSRDQLVEAELAFFAQDNAGNVWRMGEHPESYEDGVLVEAPTWLSGIMDARAGIAMLASPKLGTPGYSQGWGPAVGFTDRGQVFETELQVCTPLDCFEGAIRIRESSLAEKNAFQFKYYAPGKYNIRVDWQGENQKQELLELVEIVTLDPASQADTRAKALELEKHAYEISKDVYGLTMPMELPSEVK